MSNIVRRDKHGLFIRADGYVWRPLFPVDYPGHPNGSICMENDHVTCRHRSGTPLATVKREGVNETWFSHGGYIDMVSGRFYKSVACFKPTSFSWPRWMEAA